MPVCAHKSFRRPLLRPTLLARLLCLIAAALVATPLITGVATRATAQTMLPPAATAEPA
jgi:hypothetical protein